MPPEYFFQGYIALHLALSLTQASFFQLTHVAVQCMYTEPGPGIQDYLLQLSHLPRCPDRSSAGVEAAECAGVSGVSRYIP